MRKHCFWWIAVGPLSAVRHDGRPGKSSRTGGAPCGSANGSRPDRSGQPRSAADPPGAARQVDEYDYDTLVNVTGPGKIVSGLATVVEGPLAEEVRFTLFKGHLLGRSEDDRDGGEANFDFVGTRKQVAAARALHSDGATVTANNSTRTVTVTTSTRRILPAPGTRLVHLVCSKGLADRNSLVNGTDGSGPYKLTAVSRVPVHVAVRKGYRWGPGGATTAGMVRATVVQGRHERDDRREPPAHRRSERRDDRRAGPRAAEEGQALLDRHRGPAGELFFNENPGHPGSQPCGSEGARAGAEPRSARHGRNQRPRAQDEAALAAELHAVCGQLRRGQRPRLQPVGGALRAVGHEPQAALRDRRRAFLPADRRARTAAAVRRRGEGVALAAEHRGAAGDDLRQRRLGRPDHRHRRREPVADLGLDLGPTPPHGINFAGINNRDYKLAVSRATRRVGAAGCKYWLDAERAMFKAADIAPLR